MQNDRWVIWHG